VDPSDSYCFHEFYKILQAKRLSRGLLLDLSMPWGERGAEVLITSADSADSAVAVERSQEVASIWREFLECTDKKNLITLEAEPRITWQPPVEQLL